MTKLVTFADTRGPRLGAVLEGGRVLDLTAAASGALAGRTQDMLALIEGGPAALAAVKALAANPPAGAAREAGAVKLLAPIPRPRRNVFCVAATTNTIKPCALFLLVFWRYHILAHTELIRDGCLVA